MSDVLIVDDEPDICQAVTSVLKNSGISAEFVTEGRECVMAVNRHSPKVVILDLWFKDFDLDGFNLLKLLKENNPDLPVIIISGQKTLEVAQRAVQLGAFGFFAKPVDKRTLLEVVRYAMEVARLRHEKVLLKDERIEPIEMVGSAPAFMEFKRELDRFVDKNTRVLLRGRAGTGKQHAARFIHAQSGRREEPFISVNLSTLERMEAKAELFGRQVEYGKVQPGMIEKAGAGTLYLEEVTELPSDVQGALLRAIASSSYQRIGGSEQLPLDCRFISSTSKNIESEVEEGLFNRDLFNRLNVISAHLPTLEERLGDIELLAEHFVEYFHRTNGLPYREFDPLTKIKLTSMNWPGNIRQLRNLIERILITGPEKGKILPDEILLPESNSPFFGYAGDLEHLLALPLRDAREEFEREYLIRQINKHNGSIKDAAKAVGMERSALHRKLKGLDVTTKLAPGGRVATKSSPSETSS